MLGEEKEKLCPNLRSRNYFDLSSSVIPTLAAHVSKTGYFLHCLSPLIQAPCFSYGQSPALCKKALSLLPKTHRVSCASWKNLSPRFLHSAILSVRFDYNHTFHADMYVLNKLREIKALLLSSWPQTKGDKEMSS